MKAKNMKNLLVQLVLICRTIVFHDGYLIRSVINEIITRLNFELRLNLCRFCVAFDIIDGV